MAMTALGLLSACGGDDPPGVPSALAAAAGDAQVSLSWVAAPGASTYNLYWSNSAGVTPSTGMKIADSKSPFVHSGLTNGLTYHYVATALNGDGESAASAPAVVTLAPDAPVGVAVTAADFKIKVDWTASVGATSYNFYWSTKPGVTPQSGLKVSDVKAPYESPVLDSGLTYYAVVTAVNDGGESPVSAEVSVALPPDAPTSVSAVSGNAQVTIDWNDDDVVGATSFNLYWSNAPGVTKINGTKLEGVKPPFVHAPLVNGTTYYYVVTAVGDGGEGADSTQVSAIPQVPAPSAPQSVSAIATPETTKSVTINWSAPQSPADPALVLSYNLYRSTTPGIDIAAVTTTRIANVVSPHIDVVPAGQVTYYYVVTAVTAGGEGASSAEVSATPKGSPSGGGGETGFGNNLSTPLVFAEGLGITGAEITGTDHTDLATGLRPTATDVTNPFPYLNPADMLSLDGVDYYKQQSSSTWQANWINGRNSAQSVELDWGDNLGSAALSSNQVIRVETVLRQYKGVQSWAADVAMLGYPMQLLYGTGKAEMQGTTGVATDATERRVFAATARLKIEKLDASGTPVPNNCAFEGSIADGLALADGSRLPKYSSEINVGGSLTYGFNWFINRCSEPNKAGKWRITFSLDNAAMIGGVSYSNNTSIYGLHPSETSAVLESEQSSYIDVTVN
jgi:hypothetical protein